MKSLIIYTSITKNTEQVAYTFGSVFEAFGICKFRVVRDVGTSFRCNRVQDLLHSGKNRGECVLQGTLRQVCDVDEVLQCGSCFEKSVLLNLPPELRFQRNSLLDCTGSGFGKIVFGTDGI